MSGERKKVYEIPVDLRKKIEAAGVRVEKSRAIDHATQHVLSLGADRVTLNVYSTGKTSEGGKESALKALVRDHRVSASGRKKAGARKPSKPANRGNPGFTIPSATSRVGTDEAGKGEYFGPLVVTGVRVHGEEQDTALRKLGVRDSKDLGIPESLKLAAGIRNLLEERNIAVISLSPPEYDARWRAAGRNVNRLLGQLNVEIIDRLKAEVELAVVDAFGVKAKEYVESGGIEGVRIEARPRAEDDAAVAAASILARSRYLEEMERLTELVGFVLPRGSTHVIEAARRVYAELGEAGLRETAKFHFSITDKIIPAREG
ncbi:ribonuclease HIII [Rubrobacter indicoceani]|uniref:ribonuclease HIII n=1 Tax=Rubrobacter indicoceani TaxID=2051957 RepID=UPI000E5B9278|nr:ribonuclease HIII [Rubrobacter indicoceani]